MVPHADNRSRIGSSIVDAFGALLQCAQEPEANFLVFSSWLARECSKTAIGEDFCDKRMIELVKIAVRT